MLEVRRRLTNRRLSTGLYVLPGGVDTHVHMENVIGPTITCDTFASGTKAAAFGGTTTVVDFALQTAQDSVLGAIARANALDVAEGETQVLDDTGSYTRAWRAIGVPDKYLTAAWRLQG